MIDFNCVQCGKLLRTPAEAAGKQAQCPSCGAIQPIPVAGAPGGAESAMPTSTGPGGLPPGIASPNQANPYAGVAYQTEQVVARRGTIVPSPMDIGDVLSRSWQIAKPQIGWIFLFGLVYIAVSFGVGMVLQTAVDLFTLAANLRSPEASVIGGIAVQFASQLASIFISLGGAIFMLKMARGEPASLMDLLAGAPYFLRGLGASIVFGVLVLGVAAICLLPSLAVGLAAGFDAPPTLIVFFGGLLVAMCLSVYLFLMFGQFLYVLVDRDCGVMEALSTSRQITAGNRIALFVIYLLGSVMGIVGMCAFCFPYLFVIGYMFLMLATAYLIMSGQPTAMAPAPYPAPAYSPGAP